MSSMIYCHLNVIMSEFTLSPTAGVPADVTATLEMTDQTPSPDGTPYFTLTGQNLKVNAPKGTPVRVEYALVNKTGSTDIFYMFGMFFTNPPKKVEDDIGVFPLVLIAQEIPVQATIDGLDISPAPHTVSVVDQNNHTGFWEYTIGIQDVNTGAIGLYDPGFENEN